MGERSAPAGNGLPARDEELSAATLHEAAGRRGVAAAALRPVGPGMKVWGPVYPVKLAVGGNLALHHAIYAAQPGEVIVALSTGEREHGYWGEIMTEAAQARGIAGLVIDGGVRDVARLRELCFPVFSRSICVRGTHKHAADGSVGEPIELDGTRVERGDLVVGDDDGVVIIERSAAADVIARGRRRLADEAEQIRRVRSGERTIDIFGLPDLEGG